MDDTSTGFVSPDSLSDEAIQNIERIIAVFRKEFGDRCDWSAVPQPADDSSREHNKFLIATLGFCVRELVYDDAMLARAKKIPELSSMTHTAEELRENSAQ